MKPRWKQVKCEFNLYPLYEENEVMCIIMIFIIYTSCHNGMRRKLAEQIVFVSVLITIPLLNLLSLVHRIIPLSFINLFNPAEYLSYMCVQRLETK